MLCICESVRGSDQKKGIVCLSFKSGLFLNRPLQELLSLESAIGLILFIYNKKKTMSNMFIGHDNAKYALISNFTRPGPTVTLINRLYHRHLSYEAAILTSLHHSPPSPQKRPP